MDRTSGGAAPGLPVTLAPGLQCVLAPNPSSLTGPGTNTYLLGDAALAVIDPGPDDPAHLGALLSAIGGRPVSHIVVTHAHRDHSGLAPRLSRRTGAPVLAHGGAMSGRSPVMAALAAQGLSDDSEGPDFGFVPDAPLAEGDELIGADWRLRILHTPGHMGGHLSLVWGDTVFCGDTVMGWASSLVSPPDGDMSQYMASLARLAAMTPRLLYPGHGGVVTEPGTRIAALIAHRRAREAGLLQALAQGPATPAMLTAMVYRDIDPTLWPAATRNVLAHLIDLTERKETEAIPAIALEAVFRRL